MNYCLLLLVFWLGMPKTWKASFMYAIKKIIRFWPLHFCVLLIMFLRTIIINGCIQPSNILIALDNALLLQAWSLNQDVYFSYNGASWFLSALIFCYFMAPLLLTFCQKIKQSIVLFVMIAAIRYLIEYVNIKCPGMVWNFVIHTSPLIRCLEFLYKFFGRNNNYNIDDCFMYHEKCNLVEGIICFLVLYCGFCVCI